MVEAIDYRFPLRNELERFGIVAKQGIRGHHQILRHVGEQPDDLAFDILQLLLEGGPQLSHNPEAHSLSPESFGLRGRRKQRRRATGPDHTTVPDAPEAMRDLDANLVLAARAAALEDYGRRSVPEGPGVQAPTPVNLYVGECAVPGVHEKWPAA